jgi:hypothetical protein
LPVTYIDSPTEFESNLFKLAYFFKAKFFVQSDAGSIRLRNSGD